MRFEVCEMPRRHIHKATKIFRLLTQFAESEAAVAQVFDYDNKKVEFAARSINTSAKRFNMTHIHAFTACGNLYIENKALSKKSE